MSSCCNLVLIFWFWQTMRKWISVSYGHLRIITENVMRKKTVEKPHDDDWLLLSRISIYTNLFNLDYSFWLVGKVYISFTFGLLPWFYGTELRMVFGWRQRHRSLKASERKRSYNKLLIPNLHFSSASSTYYNRDINSHIVSENQHQIVATWQLLFLFIFSIHIHRPENIQEVKGKCGDQI